MKKWIIIALLGVFLMTGLWGCFAKRYPVDYQGNEAAFLNAKPRYAAGSTVQLKVPFATDTSYSVQIEGVTVFEELGPNGEYLVYSFRMPDHPITVRYSEHNDMLADIDPNAEGTELLVYTHETVATVDGDSYESITVSRAADGMILLDYYDGAGTRRYLAPESVYEDVMDVITAGRMDLWNENCVDCLDGAVTKVHFWDASMQWCCASTEAMPEDGMAQLNQIARILFRAIENGAPQ